MSLLKEKYPTSNYDPDPECRFCKGSGERFIQGDESWLYPCICIFVGGSREEREEIASGLERVAKQELEELRKKGFGR